MKINKAKFKTYIKNNWLEIILLCLAFGGWFFVIFAVPNPHVDETTHNRQIHRFINGNYKIKTDLTTIPGYHIIMATLAKLSGFERLWEIRSMSLILSSAALIFFFLIAKELHAKNPFMKMLQFVFLPLSYVYFPLLYTDAFSLAILLAAFYFSIKKRYWAAALFSLISLLVRQNNIIWIIFFWAYSYILENQYEFSFKKISSYIRQTIGYIIVFMAFGLFFWINQGVAIGDKALQQAGFYRGNIYFFLVIAGILFLPMLFIGARKISLKNFLIFGLGIGILIALSFFVFVPELHKYNLKVRFLKNLLLFLAYHKYIWLYASAILLGYLAIFRMKFEKHAYAIFPFIAAGLIPSMFIDERYYIVPFALILLFRKELSRKVESSLTVYFIILLIIYANDFYFH